MSNPNQLHRLTDPTVSCLYAAGAALTKPFLIGSTVPESVEQAIAAVRTVLEESYIPAAAFWDHIVPLSAGRSPAEAVEVALIKIVGREQARMHQSRINAAIMSLRSSFALTFPGNTDEVASAITALRQRWDREGAGLLNRVVNWTEPGVLVGEATVVAVSPLRNGGGIAYLPYNLACIEVVSADPIAELPETVRLAWLLSVLNLDLPIYSENLKPERLRLISGLAMIPVVLTAAQELSLASSDDMTIALAVDKWFLPGECPAPLVAAVVQWWDVYRTLRTPWAASLQALEKLLVAT